MIVQITRDFLIPLLAFAIGIRSFQALGSLFRLFFFKLACWLVTLIFSYLITLYQKEHSIQQNNQWLYNISLLIEMAFLTACCHSYFRDRNMILVLMFVCCVFLVSYLLELYDKGFDTYFNITDSVESVFLTLLFGIILFLEFDREANNWYLNPIIWICLGVFVYFSCSLPYISIFGFLSREAKEENKIIFKVIVIFLANIRYLFLAVAFWLVNKDKLGTSHG